MNWVQINIQENEDFRYMKIAWLKIVRKMIKHSFILNCNILQA